MNQLQLLLGRYKNIILALLCTILFYNIVTQNILLLLLIFCVIYFVGESMELFDSTTTKFVPLGHDRYDLRGFRLNTHPLYDCRENCHNNCYNSNF